MDWRYIAGFMDGEGSILKAGETDYRISIAQAHEPVLLAIQKFTGMGNICKVRKREAHWKDSWVYAVARQEDVLRFLKNVRPYAVVKEESVARHIPILSRIVVRNRKKKVSLRKRIKNCKLLRRKGFSYRMIGKALQIDHGYARRLILYR